MKWIAVDDILLITYCEVTAEQLDIIRNNSNYYADKAFINEIIFSTGRHAHVYGIVCNSDYDWMKEWFKVSDKYDSVSWWNREENKFYIKESLCHKQSLT